MQKEKICHFSTESYQTKYGKYDKKMTIKSSKSKKIAEIKQKEFSKDAMKLPNDPVAYSYKQLYVGSTKNDVFYLGYPLSLTDTEFAIVRILALLCGNTLNPSQLSEYCSLSGDKKSIALHIHNINRKARTIGGRNLVKNHKNQGYFLNDEM